MQHQTDLFDHLYPRFFFPKDRPIRVVELFSGIGFQRMGIELAEIPHEVIATSEIDKNAIKAYEAIHGENPNLGNVVLLRGHQLPPKIDLLTYSFPCTNLSKAGKQEGLSSDEKPNNLAKALKSMNHEDFIAWLDTEDYRQHQIDFQGTDSSLVYEVWRLLHELYDLKRLPKVLLMENVVDLIQSKFIKEFNVIQTGIEEFRYSNYTQKLNAKKYGIAQNRDRVFMASFLGEWNYNFPKPFELTTRLKDYLVKNVDEKYYLSQEQIEKMQNAKYESMGIDRVNECDGVVNTITTMVGGNREPKIFEPLTNYSQQSREGQKAEWSDISFTLSARDYKDPKLVAEPLPIEQLKKLYPTRGIVELRNSAYWIRKLTPQETGRLMGMNGEQINRQLATVSNSQDYKQDGNGIVAQVIALIVGMMYYEDEKELRRIVMGNSHTWMKEKAREIQI